MGSWQENGLMTSRWLHDDKWVPDKKMEVVVKKIILCLLTTPHK